LPVACQVLTSIDKLESRLKAVRVRGTEVPQV